MTHEQKKNLIEKENKNISMARQAELLEISRSSIYYEPIINEQDILIMNAIDKIYTDKPFYGSRRIQDGLSDYYQIYICREHIQRLMRMMGIEAIYPKPKLKTSIPDNQDRKFPYLLKDLAIIRPNQVWGTDITYIKLETGWAYLIAIIDWFSRYAISWKLSRTLQIDFCLEAVDEALEKSIPEILNSDQGSHFTSPLFTGRLLDKNVQISMDGRGRCMDNIFTERLWRSLKYENVYIKSYGNFEEANLGISEYLNFYNTERRHQSLNRQTPASVYFGRK